MRISLSSPSDGGLRQKGLAGQIGIVFMLLLLVVVGCLAFAIEFARFTGLQTQTQQHLELAQDAVRAVGDQIQYRSAGTTSDNELGELGQVNANDAALTAFAAVQSSLEDNGFVGQATVQLVEVGQDYDGLTDSTVRVVGLRIVLSTDFSWWLGRIFSDSDIGWAEAKTFTLVFHSTLSDGTDDEDNGVQSPGSPSDDSEGYGASITWSFDEDSTASRISESEYESDSVLDTSGFEDLKAEIESAVASL